MKNGFLGLLGIVLVAVAVVGYMSLYIVNPAQQALILQFGEIKGSEREPGLKFKVPFVQNVVYFDKRVLDLNMPPIEAIALDKKRLVVDAFARYRITNPVLFYQTVNNIDEANSVSRLSCSRAFAPSWPARPLPRLCATSARNSWITSARTSRGRRPPSASTS